MRLQAGVFLSITVTCAVALGCATILLLALGHRLRVASRALGFVSLLIFIPAVGEIASYLCDLPSFYVIQGQILLLFAGTLILWLRPQWNPVGQLFFASYVASAVAYIMFAGYITFAGGLSVAAVIVSSLLLFMEVLALILAGSFAFESSDVILRKAWSRPLPPFDPSYLPKVSLHVPAYNEPPDMLIETIQSLEALDYPDFEIIVIDNNTKDSLVWGPVEEYCRGRARIKFIHVDPWPGFKAGALNLALEHTDPKAEIVASIDADYVVTPDWLKRTVGYFQNSDLGFLQTPQDYREFEGDTYLQSCYDGYRYYFEAVMPSRNERNSIIFVGTMGLLRRSVLEEVGGWAEWCITEDAELSLRILKAGYSSLYIPETFGRGIMPLTFVALKKQMFRWCLGYFQLLRRHIGSLMPWGRSSSNQLSLVQRLDYLLGAFQWFNGLLHLGFSLILAASGILLLTTGQVAMRSLYGPALMLPFALLASALIRTVWALRHTMGITRRRAALTFFNWLSLSWVVALACLRGLVRAEYAFLRTPKFQARARLSEALRETRTETLMSVGLWILGLSIVLKTRGNFFFGVLFLWQGAVFAAAPYMAWLNQHTHLSARLERRQRSEDRRDRIAPFRPHLLGGAGAVAAAGLLAVLFIGGAEAPREDLVRLPERDASDEGPLSGLRDSVGDPDPQPLTETPSPSVIPTSPITIAPGGDAVTGSPLPASSPFSSPPSSPAPAPSPAVSPPAPVSPGPPSSPAPPTSPGPPASPPGRP